jgi:fatty-acyl-CoA synthase
VLNEVVAARANATAVIDARSLPGRPISYRELQSDVDAAASAMLAFGVKHGSVVAALVSNRPEWLTVAFAAAKIGALFVPVNTWYKQSELRWALNHAEAVLLVSEKGFLKRDFSADLVSIGPGLPAATPGKIAVPELPDLRTLVHLGDAGHGGALGWESFLDAGRRQPPEELAAASAAVHPDDPAMVLYTSGSTAEPKGVVLAHRGLIENGHAIGARRRITQDDRIWLGSPLFYGLGATNSMPVWLTHGATMVLQGPFTAASALDVIEHERCTVFYGMSNMIRRMYEDPSYDRSRVATLRTGTAGISPAERRILIEEMGVTGATQSYGATELYGNALGGMPDDSLQCKLETAGKPLPGFECRIVDPQTREPLPRGAVGVLHVRGHTLREYFHNPVGTAAALSPDGFYDTGDLGAFDEDGYFRFHSRRTEMLKVGGINVSPVEVEQILLGHPSISEAAVVGVPDATSGDDAVVAVVTPIGPLSDVEVRDYVLDMAASFKAPKHVLIRPADWVPRTTSGKVAKVLLREKVLKEFP